MRNARVILACRDMNKCNEAVKEIVESTKNTNVEGMQLDLNDLESVKAFAQTFLQKDLPLHALINNAGIMACPKGTTKQGYETQFGTNHMAHFLLTHLLMDKIKASAPSRVVFLSSEAHRGGKKTIDFSDINWEKSYSAFGAYSQSKLANLLTARYWAQKLKQEGIANVTVNAVHPGVIHTDLGRHFNWFVAGLFYTLGKLFLKNIPQGAATSCYVAVHPDAAGISGEYWADCNVCRSIPQGADMDLAKKLWDWTTEKLGLPK